MNDPVRGGSVSAELGEVDWLADADGEGMGVAEPGDRFGLRTVNPTAPTATTATAVTATLAKLVMGGNLHGTRMSARRCLVVSMVARAAPSTQSGARCGASLT